MTKSFTPTYGTGEGASFDKVINVLAVQELVRIIWDSRLRAK